MLTVTDTGTGMAPDVLAHVFDPFFTTKEVGKGTGLGLSMVYGFIKQSNGHVKVYSEPGRGTTFRLYLPRTAEALGQATAARSSRRCRAATNGFSWSRTNPRCAPPSLTSCKPRLRRRPGSRWRGGPGGLRGRPRPYDLLLTDVMMPGLNGKALADAVAMRWPRTRIVFMSGYAEDAIVHDGVIDAGVLLLEQALPQERACADGPSGARHAQSAC